MANPNKKSNKFFTPEKAAIFLPILFSSFLSLIIFSVFSIPKYEDSNKKNIELKEFKRKTDELPNLKIQSQKISKKLQNLNEKKSKIINLISGKSNLETFLERLGSLGEKNNIRFLSIEPKSSTNFVGSENKKIQDELNINPDQFLVEGVKKYIIDLKLNASYKDLLSFLRELEFQENIILVEDINIGLSENIEKDTKQSPNTLDGSMKIIIYGKL